MYPISSGTMLNIAAFVTDYTRDMVPAGPQSSWSTWVRTSSREELLHQYPDFGPDAQAILKCVDKVSKWAVHGIYPALETHVALVRDDVSLVASDKRCLHDMLSGLIAVRRPD